MTTITITNYLMTTSYINYIQLKQRLVLSLVYEARLNYAPAPQAEHRHAAGLIHLLFKGHVICFYSCFATQAG